MGKFKIGLQLYSVRDKMAEDMEATLKAVKEMGYDYVEFAGYFGKTAEEVRKLLDDIGLECISVHQAPGIFKTDYESSVEYLKTIGAKYVAIPWINKEDLITDEFVNLIKDLGAKFKKDGLTLLYHNHDFEFNKYEGKFILDWLYDTIDASLLETEIDTCWVRYAGYDPAEYVKKYTGRAPIVHLKDFKCSAFDGTPVYGLIDEKGENNEDGKDKKADFMFQPVGHGVQDVPSIIAAAEAAGAHTLIVEQDKSDDRPSLESVKMSIDYLKSLGL